RGRVRAGAEGAAGVDDDGGDANGWLLPRRADPQAAGAHGPVERAPALLPASVHVRSARPAEHVPEPLLARGIRVGEELEPARGVELLETLGEELEHPGAGLLGAPGRNRHRHAPERTRGRHRNALFSRWKKPSPAAYVSSLAWAANSSSSRRCSSVRRRGTVTLTRIRWSPRPEPCSTGMPRPASTSTSPGCVPGSNSSSRSPSSVGTVTRAPSAASVIVRSTVEKRSFPSRTNRSSGLTCTRT